MNFGKNITKSKFQINKISEDNKGDQVHNFDFYQDYTNLKDILTQFIPRSPDSMILNVGVGTSKLPEKMYNEGYKFQINVDRSETCIEMMRRKFSNMPKTFQCIFINNLDLQMDALQLEFQDQIFTHCIDKGLLDSITVKKILKKERLSID